MTQDGEKSVIVLDIVYTGMILTVEDTIVLTKTGGPVTATNKAINFSLTYLKLLKCNQNWYA